MHLKITSIEYICKHNRYQSQQPAISCQFLCDGMYAVGILQACLKVNFILLLSLLQVLSRLKHPQTVILSIVLGSISQIHDLCFFNSIDN